MNGQRKKKEGRDIYPPCASTVVAAVAVTGGERGPEAEGASAREREREKINWKGGDMNLYIYFRENYT